MAIRVAESRTVPVPVETAYERTLVVPLPDIFVHRHLAIPPVTRVEGQDGEWGQRVGQTRTIRTSDGGSLHETLTELDRPRRFTYDLDRVRGPMRPLVGRIAGAWTFETAGSGTTVTWSWELTPTSPITAPVVALVARMWRGYARHSLATLEAILVRP